MSKYFAEGDRPSLQEVLDHREARQERIDAWKEELREDYAGQGSILCFKLNIPGPVKNNAWIERIFEEGWQKVWEVLTDEFDRESPVIKSYTFHSATGPEGYLLSREEGELLKRAMIRLEEEAPLGRLYDMDVEDLRGPISREDLGFPERKCLICDQPARLCARSRRHSVEEMLQYMDAMIDKAAIDGAEDKSKRD